MSSINEEVAKNLLLLLEEHIDHSRALAGMITTFRTMFGDQFLDVWMKLVKEAEANNFKGMTPKWTVEARKAFEEFGKS